MHIRKGTLKASPFVGVFGAVSDKLSFFPPALSKKERHGLEDLFGTEVIETTISNSSLVGVFVRGNSKGFLVPSTTTAEEKQLLEEQGIKSIELPITAIGNLVSLNDSIAFVSEMLSEEHAKKISDFLKIKVIRKNIASTEITGASLLLTNKGFIVNPNLSDEEFDFLKKETRLEGIPTTANYGDPYVSNNVLANSHGVLAGNGTSGPEMMKIDESLIKEVKEE